MRTRHASCLFALLTVALGCSSDPAPAPTDAGTATDTPSVTDTPAATDTPGGCEDFTGAFALEGTCSVAGFRPFPAACVVQTGCTAVINVQTGPTTGTVVGNRLTFTSMVSGIGLECTATRGAGGVLAVRCEAAGGIASCDATGTPVSFPGATRYCCDVSAQDCGAGQRCNLVNDGTPAGAAVTACTPSGDTASGATCTRADGRLGADTCSAGLFCTNYGNATSSDRTCQRLCRSTADCTGGASCLAVGDAPRTGVCVAPCTPQGTDCAQGSCRYVNTWGATDPATAPAISRPACLPNGMGAVGASCTFLSDCGPNLGCARPNAGAPFVCAPVCDATHPCAAGTCNGTMSPTNPDAAGFCFP